MPQHWGGGSTRRLAGTSLVGLRALAKLEQKNIALESAATHKVLVRALGPCGVEEEVRQLDHP